jgi:hypothetical protein
MSDLSPSQSLPLFKLILAFLGIDTLQVVTMIRDLIASLPFAPQPGLYEVLDYDARLELQDTEGKRVTYFKRQRVRFLQDNIIAYQDNAWGDGNIFTDYQCSPGIPVDRYREGHRYRVLISLRATKQRGDIEEFYIQRTITDGFTRTTEDFQTEIDHKTQKLSLSVVFPMDRNPKEVRIVEQKAHRTLELGRDHCHRLPDGRLEVRWETTKPRRFEAYILHWSW